MSNPKTFLWHDYETFGTHPALDRPAQFAAIRTNSDLEPIGEPLNWHCAPADDLLPHPVACLITGITPQDALEKGVCEAEFAKQIHGEMMEPGTCSVGYNSIKFDDEFTRHIFYRNFRDAYEREWRNGNSRFDLIGLARMCYALRPQDVEWPINDKGSPSFKLEDLTRANSIGHEGAHDALADVQATIDFAALLKKQQPRLWDWALGMRNQKTAMGLLNVLQPEPVLHTSGRIPANRGCTSLFLPLSVFPDRPKSVIAIDLMSDPDMLINGTAEQVSDLVFTSSDSLPEGMERIPLKAIHTNKVPMLAPVATLRGVDTDRISLDVDRCLDHAGKITQQIDKVRPKVMEVFSRPFDGGSEDPDLMLYSGDFFSSQDRSLMNRILQTPQGELGTTQWPFKDRRLTSMLLRYRARNYPESLSPGERETWDKDRRQRIYTPPDHRQPGLEELTEQLVQLRSEAKNDGRKNRILDQLDAWYQGLADDLGE